MLNLPSQQMYVRSLFGSHNLYSATHLLFAHLFLPVGQSSTTDQAAAPRPAILSRITAVGWCRLGAKVRGVWSKILSTDVVQTPGGVFYIAPFRIYRYINTDQPQKFSQFLMPHRIAYA